MKECNIQYLRLTLGNCAMYTHSDCSEIERLMRFMTKIGMNHVELVANLCLSFYCAGLYQTYSHSSECVDDIRGPVR